MKLESIQHNPAAPAEQGLLPARQLREQTRRERTVESQASETDYGRGRHREELEDHVEQLNEILDTFDRKLSFEVHEGTNRHLVRVMDARTEEVLREIPPEEVLDMVARIEEMVGIVIDERI